MATALRINAATGFEEVVEIDDPVPAVPEVVSRRQALRALLAAGLLALVEPAIAALPSPQREIAQIEWQATEFRRDHELIALIGVALGLTESQIDALFIDAATYV